MKITECYLYNFGRFKNYKISFKDGLNCISADNGYGKTTICDFIRIMLFGMKDTRKLGIIDNDRRHYLPWNNEVCRGAITVSTADGVFRIERSFGSKASEDSLTVYDVRCELPTDKLGPCPGRAILGIDADTFERTLYISDRGYTASSESRAINEIISGSNDGETSAVIDRALKKLDEERKIYQKRGGGGEIADIRCEVAELDVKIKDTENKLCLIDELKSELKSLNEKITDTKKQIAYSRSDYERVRLSEIRKTFGRTDTELRLSIERDEARILEISEFFGGSIPTLMDIELSKGEISQSSACDGADSFFKKRVPTEEEIQRMTKAAMECKGGKKRRAFLFPFAVGVISLLSGVILGSFYNTSLFLISLFGILVLVSSLVLSKKGDTKGVSYKDIQKFISDFPCPDGLSQYEACLLIHKKYFTLCECRKKKSENDSVGAKHEEAKKKILEYEYLKDSLRRKKQEIEALRENYQKSDAYAYRTTLTEEDVARREKELSDRLLSLESERTLLVQSIESTEKLIPQYRELTAERDALSERLSVAEKKLDIIMKTQQLLIETSNGMAKEQLGATNRSFKAYLGAIDPSYTSDTNLNISFDVMRQEMGASHLSEAYSKGTRDLFEFSTKLAIADAAFGSAKPFIILDDPFVYLDDGRLESAKRLLYSLSRERQILYFTASKFRGM